MNPEIAKSHAQDPPLAFNFSRFDILAELEHVSRVTLSKKAALRKMLRFVVEATLDGRGHSLKEYTIATLVFGKAETFDPRMTSLVRTQASKLREALIKHYAEVPAGKGPWLWVPAGSYRAVFDQNPALLARTLPVDDRNVGDLRVGASVRIAPVGVFPRTGNLYEIGQAVFCRQRENFIVHKLLVPSAEPPLQLSPTTPNLSLEVKQTIVELDGHLLLTAIITAGPTDLVLFGSSVAIPWSGDAGKAISALSVPLAQFASTCASLLTIQSLSKLSSASCELQDPQWDDCSVSGLMELRQGSWSGDSQANSA